MLIHGPLSGQAAATLREYGALLQPLLTPSRWIHSLGVMQMMGDLAPIYGLDPASACAAGLLHDVAKDFSAAAQLQLVDDFNLELNDPSEAQPVYLHGVVGAAFLQQQLGYADVAVLEAIAAHSYNRSLSPTNWRLGWCLRVADVLAPVHEWSGMRRLHQLACAGELATAARLLSRWVSELYQQWMLPVHPLLAALEQELCAPVADQPDFFVRW
jgi:predicted HD superfamily hydrolase involved in NAD metabolism